MTVWAVVVAAGSGNRFGGPKQFVSLYGKPLAAWSVDVARSTCDGVVLVLPPGDLSAAEALGASRQLAHRVVAGGATRSESVRAGLAAVPATAAVVVVHDAARPLATAALFERVVAAVRDGAAAGAVPALPLHDTIKRVADDQVVATVAREDLVAVQTPQAFSADVLRLAHAGAQDATDDATLVEALGLPVRVVPGELTNLKVTLPGDLQAARAVLAARDTPGADPWQLAHTGAPSDPATPGDPGAPGNPATPGDPGVPGNTATPGDPGAPGNTATPGDPAPSGIRDPVGPGEHLGSRKGGRAAVVDAEVRAELLELHQAQVMPAFRIGQGFDVHPFDRRSARALVLGGVMIPDEPGLIGYSDADVVAHALADAVLGAAGRGDIGSHFPADQARWAGVDSVELLRRSVAMVLDDGWHAVNAQCTVICERPRLAEHLSAMATSLSAALEAPVSITAKRAEGLGAIGRVEGIACLAVALLAGGSQR